MSSKRGFAPVILILLAIALIATTTAGYFFFQNQQPQKPKVENIAPTPTTTTSNLDKPETLRPTIPLKPTVIAPATFGFTKINDLPGIGVRAAFPENAKISYFDPKTRYSVNFPDGWVEFNVYNYQGGSRRVWFRDNIGRPESTFEAFGANNHEGYISVSKDSSGNVYDLYYFTVIGTNKMLVASFGFGTTGTNNQVDKFKSLISTMQIIEPNLQGIARQDQVKLETQRWSDTRKTVWENSDLGLRVTAPDWIENRMVKARNDDGTWNYYDWTRINPEAKGDKVNGIYITGFYFTAPSLTFLDKKYTGELFSEVVNDLLPGAGFCSKEWKNSKSDCGDIHPEYCYTKDEVVQSLVLRKTAKFGPYTGQLRGINASFSQKSDCRGEDVWLIQAKGGQYVLSTIFPDTETIKLEGF